MLRLRDIMTAEVLSLSPELSIRDAMEILGARHVSGAPVMSGDRVLGVVSTTDLMQFAAALPGAPTERPEQMDWDDDDGDDSPEWNVAADPTPTYFTDVWDDAGASVDERFNRTMGPEWNMLDEHSVSEAMTSAPVRSLPPDASVVRAAEYMQHAGIHRVLVMTGESLIGIVTATDITRAVAQRQLS
jgi:CBS domain-containing protein